MAPRILLPAASKLRPIRQGDSDSLCGLYSIINGVRLALHPRKLTRAELKALFVHGIKFLSRSKRLPEVLAAGVPEPSWMRLCDSMLEHAGVLTGLQLRRSYILRSIRGTNSREGLAIVRRELRRGRPVVILLQGAYDHYTVVAGYSEARVQLFDSHNFHWLQLSGVGLYFGRSMKRHQIVKRSAVSFWVADHSGSCKPSVVIKT